jgi:ubiquinone/menaquinone biosynthesis C-methylase UbiE
MNQPSSSPSQLSNIATNVRHFLWNDDYIELLSHKLDLQKVRTLVDIGSGLGYLSGLFAIYMRAGAQVLGFDRDADAIQQAQAFADQNPYSVNFKFEVADAHALPLEDGQADLAICQHLMVFIPDALSVVKEMARIVKPGGKVVAFEPNSLVQSLVLDTVSCTYTLEERLMQVRCQAYYERGKRQLKGGDDSVGDRLPQLFLDAGLTNVEVRLSDKASALIPPYDTEEKRARVHELMTWLDSYQANRDYIRTCFLQGGGTEAEFEAFEAWEKRENERVRELIAQEKFVHPGGLMTYIVIGTKA